MRSNMDSARPSADPFKSGRPGHDRLTTTESYWAGRALVERDDQAPLKEGWLFKIGRKLTGRQWRERYFVCRGPLLLCYKIREQAERGDKPEKVVRLDCADGHVEDTGLLRLNSRRLYSFTICHRSLTSGEQKRLRIGASQPEEVASWKEVIQKARNDALNRPHESGIVTPKLTPRSEVPPTQPPQDEAALPARPVSASVSPTVPSVRFAADAGETEPNPTEKIKTPRSAALNTGTSLDFRDSAGEAAPKRRTLSTPQLTTPPIAGANGHVSGEEPKKLSRRGTMGHIPVELERVGVEVENMRRSSPVDVVEPVLRPGRLTGLATQQQVTDEGKADGKAARPGLTSKAEDNYIFQEKANWRLTKVENGLRFFEEVCDDGQVLAVPCVKAMGRVRAPPDAVFKLVMDLEKSRADWDTTFDHGKVVESVDGHTDIVHHVLRPLPLWFGWPQPRARDMCLQRYWRRDEDGTYIILMGSIENDKCPATSTHVRAEVLGGGFIITPIVRMGRDRRVERPDSLVMQLLEMRPQGWMWPKSPLAYSFYQQLLTATGGIREIFDQMGEDSIEALWEDPIDENENDNIEEEEEEEEEEVFEGEDEEEEVDQELWTPRGSDGPALSDSDAESSFVNAEACPNIVSNEPSSSETEVERKPSVERKCPEATKASQDSPVLTRQHSSGRRKLNSLLSQRTVTEAIDKVIGMYGNMPYFPWTLSTKEKPGNKDWGWSQPDGNLFRVRSKRYLLSKQKIKAGQPLGQLVATDWFKSNSRMDNIAGRVDGICQRQLLKEKGVGYIVAFNIQVPAQQQYSMVNYFAFSHKPDPETLLGKFLYGDDKFRNARFKLIPSIAKGPWVVQRSVGTTPLLVGGALKIDFHQGERYFEVDIDIGSSAVANSVVRFVFGYARYIVVDIAYLVQANTEEELPEQLLGTLRIAYLDLDVAIAPPPEKYVEKIVSASPPKSSAANPRV
ncbi:hypothetical protein CYMTET_26677 [Cymbomonas tetramitiformis]|uniref:PH domain-containing protein n=1 Tax=Cymbomonas tetramitiformis TaxID=36881 RepID=A0AAE0KY10_9CHLO|nr:hypothetical protein CYMTET_26677 [Cymbomonas tetramitiformis]